MKLRRRILFYPIPVHIGHKHVEAVTFLLISFICWQIQKLVISVLLQWCCFYLSIFNPLGIAVLDVIDA
jgi:hypothetical protein